MSLKSVKRRRGSESTETNRGKAPKKSKFTLENVTLPSILKSGVVLVTGAGDVGQLGLGSDVLEKSRFTVVNLDHEIVDICAGGMHTVLLTKEGKVLTCGCNDEGALGRITADEEDSEFTPREVDLPDEVVQISAGDSHTAVLLKDQRVFIWGTFRDSHGNMGLTPRGNEKLPYEIMSEHKHTIVKIASGGDHVAFLTKQGEIFTCGCGEQGQLGRLTERGSGRTARSGGGVDQLSKLLYPTIISTKLSLKLRFDDIWAGAYATFAKVAGKDTIYVFGLNNYNQLGLKALVPQFSPTLSREFSSYQWQTIGNGQHHTIGLTKLGKVFAIGRKEYGRLGLGRDHDDAVSLTAIPALEDKKVVEVNCGSATSFAVTDEGELYGWGMGGPLGTGTDEDCVEPTLIKSKQLLDRQVLKVSGGGQHTVILATSNNNNKGNSNSVDSTQN